VCVTYFLRGEKQQIKLVIKGHKPGAFSENICQVAYEKAGIDAAKPYSDCFTANEFRWLFEGEYHFCSLYPRVAAKQLVPKQYGRYYDREESINYVFIEFLENIEHLNEWQKADSWAPELYEAAIDGLASLHAPFLNKQNDSALQKEWLVGPFTCDDFQRAMPLWQELFARLSELHPEEIDENVLALQKGIIADIPNWSKQAEQLPSTIIHGDFNPRNFGFIKEAGQWQLMALDWECIRWGLPQFDLAQFLLHSCSAETLLPRCEKYVELMRERLEQYSGIALDKVAWQQGFEVAVKSHLISRGPLLSLVAHYFMPGVENIGLQMWRNAKNYLLENRRS
jgi:thiamine kinase-like enzyme